jgi:putative transposase
MQYRRQRDEGGTYFFTVVTFNRKPVLVENIARLRQAFDIVIKDRPFTIDAHVIMPDHIHMIWTLPEFDSDYPTRWRLIKHYFSKMMESGGETISHTREMKKERQVWQRRYWEHVIRDDKDLANHIEYIHYNPVKHGFTTSPDDWDLSSFHKYVKEGFYPEKWIPDDSIRNVDFPE